MKQALGYSLNTEETGIINGDRLTVIQAGCDVFTDFVASAKQEQDPETHMLSEEISSAAAKEDLLRWCFRRAGGEGSAPYTRDRHGSAIRVGW